MLWSQVGRHMGRSAKAQPWRTLMGCSRWSCSTFAPSRTCTMRVRRRLSLLRFSPSTSHKEVARLRPLEVLLSLCPDQPLSVNVWPCTLTTSPLGTSFALTKGARTPLCTGRSWICQTGYRSKANGWFLMTIVHNQKLQSLAGGASALFTAMLKAFFPPEGFNLTTTGMRIPIGTEMLFFQATFACLISDEKAIKEALCAKGASGSKPCVSCKNIVGRVKAENVAQETVLRHHTCPNVHEFQPHTFESVREACQHLAINARLVPQFRSAKEFGRLQQALGFTYCEGGLPWSDMSAIAKVPDCVYWDWMHCLMASGGVAQYEVNQFLRRVARILPLDKVDEFCTRIKVPKVHRGCRIPKLEKRVVKKDKAHIRAFAGEIELVVMMLGTFCELVLEPRGMLADEVACFYVLQRISDILSSGDKSVGKAGVLRVLVADHHRRFLALYPACAKIKLHYMHHIPHCLERFRRNLSCFAMERKHRLAKHIASFTFADVEKTLLTRATVQHLTWLKEALSFQTCRLLPPVVNTTSKNRLAQFTLAGLPEARSRAGEAEPTMQVARAMSSTTGRCTKGDFVLWPQGGGLAQDFVSVVRGLSRKPTVLVLVLEFRALGTGRFSRAPAHSHLLMVAAADILGAFPYWEDGEIIHVVASKDQI